MQLGSHVLRNGEGDSHLVHDEIDVPQALRGDVEEHDEIEDVIVWTHQAPAENMQFERASCYKFFPVLVASVCNDGVLR